MEDFSSEIYWRNRYKRGRNSGSGSYGRLAVYKAHVINELLHERQISSVLEIGSGDGYQASLFEIERFKGVDVSPHCIQWCQERYKERPEWSFELKEDFKTSKDFELVMSLDVIYHLVEDSVYENYMNDLVACSERWILIYSSCHEAYGDTPHVRHRDHSTWFEKNAPQFSVRKTWENPYKAIDRNGTENTSFAFFTLYELNDNE